MAKIKGGLGTLLSGKLEGLVFVQRGNQSFLRTEPDYSKKKWSVDQQKHRERFKKVSAFCMQFKFSVIRPVWNMAPGKGSGYSRFLKANIPAFDGNGDLTDLSMLHFSDGRLPLPYNFTVVAVKEDAEVLKASWENDPALPAGNASDQLMVMYALGNKFVGPKDTGVKRSALTAVLDLPEDWHKADAVYLFFASKDYQNYSPDQYFAL